MSENKNSEHLAIYIHWPFCVSKCPYCDFNSHVRDSVNIDLWEKAFYRDLNLFLDTTHNKTVKSIFFGGGTPSLMPPRLVENLIQFIGKNWSLDPHIEITLEGNPNSSDVDKFRGFYQAGINRVSLGVQSLRSNALSFLKRAHTADEGLKAIAAARSVFPRYSFDLIYARPDQTIEEWSHELKDALDLAKGHLSLYQLTIEEGTPFYLAYHRGDFEMPDDEKSAHFYEVTRDLMKTNGYESYEVSNYALAGQECQHNLVYWRYQDYVGVGPGAHSRITDLQGQKWAIRRHRSPEEWLKKPGPHEKIALSEQDIFQEFLMMGLRITEGINKKAFGNHCPQFSLKIFDMLKAETLQKEGLLQHNSESFWLTDKGRLKLNSIWRYLTENIQ